MEWTVAAALAATSGPPGGTDDNSGCPATPTVGLDHAATITVKPPGNRVLSAVIVDDDFELADGEQFLSKTASLLSAGDRSFRGLEANAEAVRREAADRKHSQRRPADHAGRWQRPGGSALTTG